MMLDDVKALNDIWFRFHGDESNLPLQRTDDMLRIESLLARFKLSFHKRTNKSS